MHTCVAQSTLQLTGEGMNDMSLTVESVEEPLCRGTSAELSALFSERHSREALQASLGRCNPHLLSAVELDFGFPPNSSILDSCTHLLRAGTPVARSVSPAPMPLNN